MTRYLHAFAADAVRTFTSDDPADGERRLGYVIAACVVATLIATVAAFALVSDQVPVVDKLIIGLSIGNIVVWSAVFLGNVFLPVIKLLAGGARRDTPAQPETHEATGPASYPQAA